MLKKHISCNRPDIWIIILLGIALLSYTTMRALLLSFTTDESTTFGLVNYYWHDIILYTHIDANNHMLNSLLVKSMYLLFGAEKFVLRLPNLLAHCFYIYFSFKVAQQLSTSKIMALCGFAMLNFHPFLLDFFSLARGYGLEVCFMVISVYFWLLYLHSERIKSATFSLTFATLGVLSNFSLLYFFTGLLFSILFIEIYKWKVVRYHFKRVLIMTIPVVLLGVLAILPIVKLKKANKLYFGGETGFWEDTVGSLVQRDLYSQYNIWLMDEYVKTGLIVLLGLVLFAVFASLVNKKCDLDSNLVQLFLVFSITVLVVISAHHLMGVRFLIGRTSLFFIPLFFLLVISALNTLSKIKWVRIPIASIAVVVALSCTVHTINASNLDYTMSWWKDAGTEQMLDHLAEEVAVSENSISKPVRLGVYKFFSPIINYYRDAYKIEWLKRTHRYGFVGEFDYYYVRKSDLDSLRKYSEVSIIERYEPSNTVLLKNNLTSN